MEATRKPVLMVLGILATVGALILANLLLFPDLCALNRFVCFWVVSAANTFFLFGGSALFGLVIGFFGGWGRATGNPLLSLPAMAYIEFFRGIPRIVIVLMAIVIFPALGRLSPLLRWLGDIDNAVIWGIIALGVSSGAYQAEVFRAGFQSIAYGQIEAANSIGMNYWQTMRHVTLPQVIRTILPPLGNEWIIVLKDTSLLVILISIPGHFPGVFELTARARFLQTVTPEVSLWPLIFLAAAAIYLVMTMLISRTIQLLEERFKVPGLGVLRT